jgi:threonine aldolase
MNKTKTINYEVSWDVPTVFDFRSDTVTKPTFEMFEAMMYASRGDDVIDGNEESTRELESFVARLAGKPAGLFCVSGTMANQLAIKSWIKPLQSVLVDEKSHIFNYENFGISHHCQSGMISTRNSFCLEGIAPYCILNEDIHSCQTGIICLENTMNGEIMEIEEVRRVHRFAKKNGIVMHLDGARLWHASVEKNISIKEWADNFDSVSLCLSKGIGAPIGGVLVGPEEFIRKARHYRKLFGGGWRQSGILAAAALKALHLTFLASSPHNHPPLKDVHEMTKMTERLIRESIPEFKIINKVETNMIFIDIRNRENVRSITVSVLVERMEKIMNQENNFNLKLPKDGYAMTRGGKMIGSTDDEIFYDDELFIMRLVFHYQITKDACIRLLDVFRKAIDSL